MELNNFRLNQVIFKNQTEEFHENPIIPISQIWVLRYFCFASTETSPSNNVKLKLLQPHNPPLSRVSGGKEGTKKETRKERGLEREKKKENKKSYPLIKRLIYPTVYIYLRILGDILDLPLASVYNIKTRYTRLLVK